MWSVRVAYITTIAVLLGVATNVAGAPVVYDAAVTVGEPQPNEIVLEVNIEWTPKRIEDEIRKTFPENPNLAVAVALCESGLNPVVQSGNTLSYGREQSWGVFQIHAKDHHETAVRLGLSEYKSNPADNIAMARIIYDNRLERGGYAFQDWTCYNNGGYKKYL